MDRTYRDGQLAWLQMFGDFINRCGIEHAGNPATRKVPNNIGNLVDVDFPLHGSLPFTPASEIELELSEDGEIRIVGIVDDGTPATFGSDFRLLTEIVTKIGTRELKIKDWIVNNGSTEREFASFQHVNFGEPVIDDGAQLVHAFKSVTARNDGFSRSVSNPQRFGKFDNVPPNETEKVLFCVPLVGKDGKTKVMARNAEGSLGLSIEFEAERLVPLKLLFIIICCCPPPREGDRDLDVVGRPCEAEDEDKTLL